MPGLVPGIHVLLANVSKKENVDGRDKPGHDADDFRAGVALPTKTNPSRPWFDRELG